MSPRHAAFVNFYLGEANWNATRAAELVEYADPKNEGYRLLQRADVKEAIRQRCNVHAMTAEEVLTRLRQQGRGEQADFWELDAYGQPRINFEKLRAAGLAHLIKKVDFSDLTGRIVKLEFYDAQAALEKLGRHHKLFNDANPDTDKRILELLAILAGKREAETPNGAGSGSGAAGTEGAGDGGERPERGEP